MKVCCSNKETHGRGGGGSRGGGGGVEEMGKYIEREAETKYEEI